MSVAPTFDRLPCGSRFLDLSRPQVMGILNVTPDSFSDGGRYGQRDAALRHAEAMLKAGATLIDVGGESTRPGARAVSPVEELERVAPVVEAIAHELDVIISVDTSTPAVIRETARLGAGLINDVRSLQRDGALDAAATALKAAQPEMARGVAKGVLHKNTVARKFSRLTKSVNLIA